MSVAGLALDASTRSPIVLLRDLSGHRQIPIWIDHAQAYNIMIGAQKNHAQKPQSHDLMISILEAGNLLLERIVIHSIEENTFQAILKLQSIKKVTSSTAKKDIKIIEIDARPSDAIALAVRAKCSIWMLEEVVAKASIPVDVDADEEEKDEFHRFINETSPSQLINHLKNKNNEKEPPTNSPNSGSKDK